MRPVAIRVGSGLQPLVENAQAELRGRFVLRDFFHRVAHGIGDAQEHDHDADDFHEPSFFGRRCEGDLGYFSLLNHQLVMPLAILSGTSPLPAARMTRLKAQMPRMMMTRTVPNSIDANMVDLHR